SSHLIQVLESPAVCCIIKGRGNPFLARRVELFHSFPRRSCDRRLNSRSSLPFIESKVFSEKTGRRLVLTSHRRHARSPSRSCSRPGTRAPPAGDRRSAWRCAAAWLVWSCLLRESRRSRLATAPAWAASLALSAGSPAESNSPPSSALSRAPVQTPALPTVDSCPPPEPLAVHAHRSPLGTSLRCPTKQLLMTTTS